MPTVARIGIVPRRQPAEHSSEQRGIRNATVFFCDTADDASVWNDTILRFPWPEMWGRDPQRRRPELLDRPMDSAGKMSARRTGVQYHTQTDRFLRGNGRNSLYNNQLRSSASGRIVGSTRWPLMAVRVGNRWNFSTYEDRDPLGRAKSVSLSTIETVKTTSAE